MEIRIIKNSDLARCPITSLQADHYYDDGTCKCVHIVITQHEWEVLCEALERPARVLPRLRKLIEERRDDQD